MTTATRTRGRPRKALGQHFLSDGRILNRIVEAAELNPEDVVLEIGPGRGVLTRRLVERARRVIAVELDPALSAGLLERLGNPPNLTVVEGDARHLNLVCLVWPDVSCKVVGNLPYYAANPIVRGLLESKPQPKLVVVMLQEEVGRSMAARPGEMTLLSVATQYYAVPKLVCTVPPRAFRPPPKVRSVLVRLVVRDRPAIDVPDPQAFFSLVRAGFSSPRKQLTNSLSHGLGVPASVVKEVLDGLGLDGSRRPATLSLDDWAALHMAWESTREVESPRPR